MQALLHPEINEIAQVQSSTREHESLIKPNLESEHDEGVAKSQSPHGSSRKRQRSDGVYVRKRGLMACHRCRGRKTKCNNARPACSFCVGVGATCIYPDDSDSQGYSSFDPASIAIIERLDHVVGLINTEFSKLHSQADRSSTTFVSPGFFSNNGYSPAGPGADFRSTSSTLQGRQGDDLDWAELSLVTPCVNEAVERVQFANIAAAHIVTETILQWPIFFDLCTKPDVQSLVLKHDTNYLSDLENGGITRDIQPRGRVHEEDFVHLCQNFLDNVHCKNPILDRKSFMKSVREVSENGLGWDGQSCLVLIACALGAISYPFTLQGLDSDEGIPLLSDSTSKVAATAYFDAARKRLGLLPPSLLTVQCLFLSGVYEMYCVRPLNAWFSFHQASTQFKVYLVAVPHLDENSIISASDRRLEKRLYWSCMQSECELRVELRITAAGLEQLDFPNAFPSPPAGINAELQDSSHQGIGFGARTSSGSPDRDAVRSWMYYLAETSLRRVCNRVVAVLYQNGEDSWMRNVRSLIEQARECASQLELWVSHIPPQIHLDDAIPTSTNELALHLRSRHIMCRTWIYRPFLYLVTNASAAEFAQLPVNVEALAVKCLENCMLSIFDTTYRHRHHGTWYTVRIAFSCALCILAGAKSGRVHLPENWPFAIQRVLTILKIWEAESPNLKVSRQKLEIIYGDVLNGKN